MTGQSSRSSVGGGRSGGRRGRGRGGRGMHLEDIPEDYVAPAPAPVHGDPSGRQRDLCVPDIGGYVFNFNYLILIL